ncbi:MAG: hypothetical protein H0X25_11005 [Acidobacteriales bacterium]|nr:hypothetical protein [Terriglobales bacterium]
MDMCTIHLGQLDPQLADPQVSVRVLLRQEPDEDEDEDEGYGKPDNDDDDDDTDDGYSE